MLLPQVSLRALHLSRLNHAQQRQQANTALLARPASCRDAGEALLAACSTDLESGAAGLFRLHYLLLPCEPGAGQPAALCAKRVACAEELLAPMLPAGADASAAVVPLPPAVASAVTAQLARVPLEQLEPLRLSNRCCETVEVRIGSGGGEDSSSCYCREFHSPACSQRRCWCGRVCRRPRCSHNRRRQWLAMETEPLQRWFHPLQLHPWKKQLGNRQARAGGRQQWQQEAQQAPVLGSQPRRVFRGAAGSSSSCRAAVAARLRLSSGAAAKNDSKPVAGRSRGRASK